LRPRFPLSDQPALRPSRLKISALTAAAVAIAGAAGAVAASSPASAGSATLDTAAPVPGGLSAMKLTGTPLAGPSLSAQPARPAAPAHPDAVSPAAAAKPPAPTAPARHSAPAKAASGKSSPPKARRAQASPAKAPARATAADPKPARPAARSRGSRAGGHQHGGSWLGNVLNGVRHLGSGGQRRYTFYDSVTPQAIPAHQHVATYATGGFAVPASRVAGRGPVLWIDTRGYDYRASVLDVEPGDATPSVAATWAWHKLKSSPGSLACIYTMRSEWPAVRAAIGGLPGGMRSHVRYWIADPTGYPHIVPGASATQWYWGSHYDISSANSSL
jgi:hypothetical protein